MSPMYPETFRADYARLEKTPFTRARMRRLQCVVAGAGALGNEVARVLGLLGVGTVTLVDPDVVEPSNLPRSIFFWSKNAAGQNKAVTVAEAASALFPETRWAGVDREIADLGFQKLAEASVIFSCVDSDAARLEMAYISTKLGIPVIDGGLGRRNYSHGRVTYFAGRKEEACFGCMLRPAKRRELLESWDATLRPCFPQNDGEGETELVSTPTMAGMIGSLQAEFGFRLMFEAESGRPVSSRSLELQIHPARELNEFRISLSAECPFHEQVDESGDSLHTLPRPDATFGELLERAGSDTVLLDWPICTDAKCSDCGHSWRPMLRLATLRRRRCPSCESANIREQEIVRSIGLGSPWLNASSAALGLPADHLYTCGPNPSSPSSTVGQTAAPGANTL